MTCLTAISYGAPAASLNKGSGARSIAFGAEPPYDFVKCVTIGRMEREGGTSFGVSVDG